MTHYEEITWRGIPLTVSYYNGSDFYPTCITAIVDGEEGPVCDDLLPFLSAEAIAEIGEIIRTTGRD